MNVVHEITFFVNDKPIKTEWPRLSLREILRLAGEDGCRLKNLDSLHEFVGFHHEIMLSSGMRFATPSRQ